MSVTVNFPVIFFHARHAWPARVIVGSIKKNGFFLATYSDFTEKFNIAFVTITSMLFIIVLKLGGGGGWKFASFKTNGYVCNVCKMAVQFRIYTGCFSKVLLDTLFPLRKWLVFAKILLSNEPVEVQLSIPSKNFTDLARWSLQRRFPICSVFFKYALFKYRRFLFA